MSRSFPGTPIAIVRSFLVLFTAIFANKNPFLTLADLNAIHHMALVGTAGANLRFHMRLNSLAHEGFTLQAKQYDVEIAKNVLGEKLMECSVEPMTGFYRDGCCNTGPADSGTHTVCARMTREFLDFTASKGNDLSSPKPQWNFPGLNPGDYWCLCVLRWLEACENDCAPPLRLEATHEKTLEYVGLSTLKNYQIQDEHAS